MRSPIRSRTLTKYITSGLGASAARLAVYVEIANGKRPASASKLAILTCRPHYRVYGEEVC